MEIMIFAPKISRGKKTISGDPDFFVEKTALPGENHWHVESHWQAISHNVVSCTPSHERDSNSSR